MRHRITTERGLSLVEVTIILLVLMLLTGVLAPSIMDFVRDAQWVKVKEDCEAIGTSVARLTRDVGRCLKYVGTGPCTMANRADILYSDGPDVTADDLTGDALVSFFGDGATATTLNWDKDDSRGDSMQHQFVDNATGPAYPTPAELGTHATVGPQVGLGWRGAYLSPPIGPDPWGRRYLVNTVFLAVASDATTTGLSQVSFAPVTVPVRPSRGWSRDAFCISAGPDRLFATAFGGNASGGVSRGGDDFIYVISGDTR